MAKRQRRRPRRQDTRLNLETIVIGMHQLPVGWRPLDWVVPFLDNHACIHHGHQTASDDHSRCGPVLFCCGKASARYVQLYPDSAEAQAEWQLTRAEHIAQWLERGVQVLYFVFCDPQRPEGLWAIGLSGEPMRQTLYQQLPPEAHLDRADRLA